MGIPELIIDRQTGILLEPNDAPAIADAIEYLYLNPDVSQSLAKQGREQVVEKFNLETCLESLIGEFRQRLEN